MPSFTVRKQVDAYVSYYADVEADSAEEAVDLAYESGDTLSWEGGDVSEFDAVRVTALDSELQEISEYSRGDG
ncbi:hypothetical protein [Maricaulis maris]|uniref:Uncharacterized protein n=1 Tax=Maricaulis maris TaxID=74318 RepID=A0A495D4I5_9PROT|nr:hypothetical protein [Maricaulis maris]RKQ96825.1 hypothetical protein C7435_2160 [Maricaulis maris]